MLLFIIASAAVPLLMLLLRAFWPKLGVVWNILAIGCALVAGPIVSYAVYGILRDNTVFMTQIHAVFLNPLFLLCGSYLGVYFIYLLIRFTVYDRDK
ncbi:transposase [Paenibacillus rigui]|uniref:Transposase n=2 Tax=Paenibacillus rigui TaxID=554312 RepID=A0A229UVE7_9BACL|nr:transposase [Paenibacillus rigui]